MPIRSCALLILLSACGSAPESPAGASQADEPNAAESAGEAVTPPFEVRGELEGLLLVWYDAEGQHTAANRAEIPETARAHVRIDSLTVPPDKRLDADHVYVADLRAPDAKGGYAVHKRPRAWLDAHVQKLAPPPPVASEVTLYMASWCGACKAAASYLRSQNVPFVEKDIEKDAAAAAEMQKKAQAAGKTPRGVPVIDFRGTLMMGFDQQALAGLIAKGKSDPI
jgi:glutaredoxin